MLTGLDLQMDGDGCWPDLKDKREAGQLEAGTLAGVALLQNGTANGNHSVTFRIDMPDGSTVTAETTLSLLWMAANAFKTRAAMQGQHLA
jgi:hypothetical protein